MMLCLFVGASWAQKVITNLAELSNGKVYTIIPKHDVRGAMYATATSTHLDACGGTLGGAKNPGIAVDATSADQQFALYTHEGSTYLYSIGAGKYVSDLSVSNTTYFSLEEKPGSPVTVVNSDTDGYFIIKVKGTEFINVSTGWTYGCVGGWNNTDDGNRLKITEVADIPEDALAKLTADFSNQVELTYVYKTGAKEWKRETVVAKKGEAYPAPANMVGVTFTLPEGNVSAETVNGAEVVVECVIEGLPFKVSTLTDGQFGNGMSWYYLKMRNKDVTYDASSGKALTGNVDKKTVNNLFAITGNPFEGFSIYTYVAGPDKVLWRENAENAGRVTFTTNTDGNTWMLSKNGDAGYVFRLNGHATGYLNDHQPDLAIWNSSWGATDGGSTFTFEYVENPDFGGVEDLQAYIAEVNAYIASGVANGNTVGYITEESAQQVANALAAANTAVENRTGCVEALTVLKTAVANVKFIQPEEGKFYKIVSSCTKDHRAGQEVYVNNDGNMHFAKADEYGFGIASAMGRVWQFVPAAGGKFYIKNVERGVFMQSVGTASETDGTKAKAVTISNMGKNNVVSIKPDGQSQMHAQDNNSKIVGWNENNPEDGSAWVITEVSIEELAHTVTVGEAGYATLVLGYNAEIPEGVEVYTVNATEEGSAMLTMVEGVLGAGEAVVLKNAGTYNFKYTTSAATEVENLLKGTTVNTNIAEEAYVLGNSDGVGFYTATFNVNTDTSNDIVEGEGEDAVTTPVNDAFKNNAFKAYLPKTGVSATLRFNFGGTTAIESVVNGIDANAAIYDLSGRRVEKAVKGIYIQNGKKIIVK